VTRRTHARCTDFIVHFRMDWRSVCRGIDDSCWTVCCGYRVVFMKPKFAVTTIASYDEAIMKQVKGPVSDGRPTASVVHTISE
jgi:hypothetical protein